MQAEHDSGVDGADDMELPAVLALITDEHVPPGGVVGEVPTVAVVSMWHRPPRPDHRWWSRTGHRPGIRR